jgi:adenylyltransferase/sulfurtransferase|tara:strand:- start:89 stop:1261 length:1173 start_codon:yes stop_codon:yes gene_type:complete
MNKKDIESIDEFNSELTQEELIRYSRHISLREVGIDGQKKIKASKVLVVGLGGLGSPISLYLAAAGVGTIGLVDFDVVDVSNLQRQVLFGIDQKNKSKLQSGVERLKQLNPHTKYNLHEVVLSSENALDIFKDYDIIIDCTDNFPTRYLINDACVLLGKPNVYGSIYRFDGQVSIFNYNGGPCYRCLYPKPPPHGLVPSCSEEGVLGVLPGIIGILQANEVLKIILKIGNLMVNRFLLFDTLSMEFNELQISKDDKCLICGSNPSITNLIDYKAFCGIPDYKKKDYDEITVHELSNRLNNNQTLTVLDVRENHEVKIARIKGAIHIPMRELLNRITELNANEEIVVYCKSGQRSGQICKTLIKNNFINVKNLKGGIIAWSERIDFSMPEM